MTDDKSAAGAGDLPASDLDVRIVRGSPTDEELAAVIAVIAALPPVPHHRPAAPGPAQTDWRRSQRPLRTELRPRWR